MGMEGQEGVIASHRRAKRRRLSTALAKQSSAAFVALDCLLASLLAMTTSSEIRLARAGVGQERGVEDVSALRGAGLEAVGQADLLDRLVELAHVDAAEAVGLHLGGQDVVLERHLQAL